MPTTREDHIYYTRDEFLALNFEEPKTFIESNFQNYVVVLESYNYYRVLLKKIK